MIAVIKTGGKQYKVSEKDKLKVEKLEGEEGSKIVFDQILLVSDDNEKEINIGSPMVEGAKVEAKILKQARSRKIDVIKHKAKKRYNRKAGHRQYFTEVEIEKIKA
ncbi:MAG: 50S ribosomal protein L21 [Candidatus Pacebacteria bacterium]|nr:50S ribosomal protein L21 [Candidatus Paceibacterota bacterium]